MNKKKKGERANEGNRKDECAQVNSVLCRASAACEWGSNPSVVFTHCAQSLAQWHLGELVNELKNQVGDPC